MQQRTIDYTRGLRVEKQSSKLHSMSIEEEEEEEAQRSLKAFEEQVLAQTQFLHSFSLCLDTYKVRAFLVLVLRALSPLLEAAVLCAVLAVCSCS